MILRWLFLLLHLCFFASAFWASDDSPTSFNYVQKASLSSVQSLSKQEVLFQINNPTLVHGRFDGDLQLAVTEQGYCLAGGVSGTGTFEASVELLEPAKSFSLYLLGRGPYKFEIYHPHHGWKISQIDANGDLFTWQKLKHNLPQPSGSIRYRVRLSGEQALFCKLVGPATIPLDSLWPLRVATDPMKLTTGEWAGVLGVNVEAEYLFLELDREQRRSLLQQAKTDGFESVRLHKLTRLLQSLDFNSYFEATLQGFLDDLIDFGFTLSLDILSWPLKTTLSTGEVVGDGWKQWVYSSVELQNRVIQIIDWLGSFYLGDKLLFKSDKLIGICLFNENSLYAEPPSNISLISKNPCKKMLRVGSLFRNVLQNKGYTGRIFLSNYQLDGDDQICNMQFSKNIDRHLYFDYPQFNGSNLKVSGRSPLEFLNYWKAHYRKLFQEASECWISEINLPWPNQFMHEMLPAILALHKEKMLSGIWFYDYRLRSTDFHRGGPFGVQRFRSVIEPLGWFKLFLNENLRFEYKDFLLNIYSDKGSIKCTLRGHPTARVPHCIWTRGGSYLIAGPEGALGDQFDPQFLFQKIFGRDAMYLDF